MGPDERTAEGIVRAFAEAWSRLDLDGVCAMLHPEIRYHNIPLEPIIGKPAVESYLRSAGPFEWCRWTLREVAVKGDSVLTERMDEMGVAGAAIALPVMGVFEIRDGFIIAWRDYFDLASYRAQWPQGTKA